MSWSISTSGPREQVRSQIDAQVNPASYSDPETKEEVERANVGLHALLNSTRSTHVSLSASGSRQGSVYVNLSTWNE